MMPLLVEEERQAYGLSTGCEPLVRLGVNSAAKTTRMGDSDSVHFRDGECFVYK